MRWPIERQIQLPVLSVVALVLAASSAVNAWLNVSAARTAQEENLSRVVSALTDAGFPLTERVLERMRGLSGAEFVVLDSGKRLQTSTIDVDNNELAVLQGLTPREQGVADRMPVRLAGQVYLAKQVAVTPRAASGGTAMLVVLVPEERWSTSERQMLYPPLLIGVAALLISIAMTAWLARRLVRPIQQLEKHAAVVAQGDFSPLPLASRDDEIRDLTQSLNHMASQLAQYEEQVRRSERLQTLHQLGGGLVHQLRNSVAGARLAVELHQQECPLGELCETSGTALRQLQLMESYLQRFLTLGRHGATPHEPLDFSTLAAEAVELVRPACNHAKLKLQTPPHGPSLPIWGDADMLRQVLVNLLLNAVDAASRSPQTGGSIRLSWDISEWETLQLLIQDTGPGPSPAVRDRLFEPFVTEKPHGTGLGLSVSRQIAEQHGGQLTWERIDSWTTFRLALPRHHT